MSIIGDVLQLYLLVLLIRAVLSFFPVHPDSGLIPVMRTLDVVIDPVLQPLRQIIPRAGMFDFSYFVLFLIVELVGSRFPATIHIFW